MRYYKHLIVLTIGITLELGVAIFSCLLIKENGDWIASLTLPYLAPRSPFFYGVLMVVNYLSAAASLACYAHCGADLPKGILLTLSEGIGEVVTLLFFFEFTYEITSFFLATLTMICSLVNTSIFLTKNDAAGICRFPSFCIKLYLWTVIYCVLTINFV